MSDQPRRELTEPFDSGRRAGLDGDMAIDPGLVDLALSLLDLLMEPESIEAWSTVALEDVDTQSLDGPRPLASSANDVVVVAMACWTPGLGPRAAHGPRGESMARESHRSGVGRGRHRREDDQPL